MNLVHAELYKLRTLRSFWWSAVSALLLVALSVALPFTSGEPVLGTTKDVRNVLSAAGSAGALVTLIAIVLVTGEFRHKTITATMLNTPDGIRVVRAKLFAMLIAGGALAVAGAVLTLAIAAPWLHFRGVAVSEHGRDIVVVLVGSSVASTLYALVGVGLGSMVTNQTVATTGAIVWFAVIEGLLVSFGPSVDRWLPGGAAASLAGSRLTSKYLPIWGGGLVFATYAAAAAVAGALLMRRRDIA